MSLPEIWNQFVTDIQKAEWYEYAAIICGIASVWFSRIENILVYPVGLVNTILYIFLSIKGQLFGEASVNFYYTVMSVYGWIIWMKKDTQQQERVQVTFSDKKWWGRQLLFFAGFYAAIFFSLTYLKKSFAPDAIPWGDAFASAAAFTGMWLMTRKKVESWYWWIATNIASIPLYFSKHFVLTSVYYVVLLVMAVFGLLEWSKRAKLKHA